MYKAFVLDCDGVIFDTNFLKIKAFRKCLENFPKSFVEECIGYVRENFGKTREHFFHYFLSNYMGNYDVDIYKSMLKNYGNCCRSLYRKALFTEGFQDFMKDSYNKGIKLFVASGNAEGELKEAFFLHEIDSYFEGIYGAPHLKEEVIEKVLNRYDRASIAMFGDALMDYRAAELHDVDFIYISKYSANREYMESLQEEKKFIIFHTFRDFSL